MALLKNMLDSQHPPNMIPRVAVKFSNFRFPVIFWDGALRGKISTSLRKLLDAGVWPQKGPSGEWLTLYERPHTHITYCWYIQVACFYQGSKQFFFCAEYQVQVILNLSLLKMMALLLIFKGMFNSGYKILT